MKRFLFFLILLISLRLNAQEWKHPSTTWDKKNIGTSLVVSGFLMTTVPILANLPKTPATKTFVVLGVGVSMSGVVYWICGESKWDRRQKAVKNGQITRF